MASDTKVPLQRMMQSFLLKEIFWGERRHESKRHCGCWNRKWTVRGKPGEIYPLRPAVWIMYCPVFLPQVARLTA